MQWKARIVEFVAIVSRQSTRRSGSETDDGIILCASSRLSVMRLKSALAAVSRLSAAPGMQGLPFWNLCSAVSLPRLFLQRRPTAPRSPHPHTCRAMHDDAPYSCCVHARSACTCPRRHTPATVEHAPHARWPMSWLCLILGPAGVLRHEINLQHSTPPQRRTRNRTTAACSS